MAVFSWIGTVEDFAPAALTVRAQVLDPTLQNTLLWDQFFPRRNVDSTMLDEVLIEQADVPYVAERREWNTRGRPIPVISPARERYEFIPIETYFTIEEKEINDLLLRFKGNQTMMQEQIGTTIPLRTDRLAAANYRRVEKDAFDGWASGQITRRNPQLGHLSQTFSFNFDSSCYVTAGTAWNNAGVNAYNEFLKAIRLADQRPGFGRCGGALMRQATWNEIQLDATAAIAVNFTPVALMTRDQVQARLESDLGRQFVIVIFEDLLTTFGDGGITNVSTVNRWPAQKIGFIPQADGGAIGFTAFAPVVRAYDLTSQVPNAGIDVRGNTVYHEVRNGGREFRVECQLNAFPVPIEQRVYVWSVGV